MAKLTQPLMSTAAHGSLGPALTFSKRATGNQVRYQKKPKDVLTVAGALWRTKYAAGAARWHNYSDAMKEQWNILAANKNLTGFNLFMSKWLLDLILPPEYLLTEDGSLLLMEDGGRLEL